MLSPVTFSLFCISLYPLLFSNQIIIKKKILQTQPFTTNTVNKLFCFNISRMSTRSLPQSSYNNCGAPYFQLGEIPGTPLCIMPMNDDFVEDIKSETPGIKMAVSESGVVYSIYDAEPHRSNFWFYIAQPTQIHGVPELISEPNLQVLQHSYTHNIDAGVNISSLRPSIHIIDCVDT